MLFLLMQLDGNRYALDIAQVAEVLPLVQLKNVPRAPAGVAGVVDYGGAPLPVIDLSVLLANRPAHRRLNTRLIIVHYTAAGRKNLLGLIAERATETMRRDPSEFQDSGVRSASPPQLGPVALDSAGSVHWLDVAQLLPPSLADSLFQQAERSWAQPA
jgi:chemotaxis-related protein WspB